MLDFFEPGSSAAFTDCVFTGNNFCNFTTPVSGTWKITLIPAGASVGSLTLKLT